jgi:hypothetical protein
VPFSPGITGWVTESAVYGVILVAGLVVIVSDAAQASWDVLVKVLATVVVFWAAHIYAGTVAHLSDHPGSDLAIAQRLRHAARHALDHSWGMLVAALLPVTVLLLGVANVVADRVAIWGTLWLAVVVLGALGYLKVASWTGKRWVRFASASVTSVLGLVLIGLKILVH